MLGQYIYTPVLILLFKTDINNHRREDMLDFKFDGNGFSIL